MVWTQKPHVSEALRRLRVVVTAAGAILVVALLMNLLVFAFVHYTDVRWTTQEPDQAAVRELRVVRSNTGSAKSLTGKGSSIGATVATTTEPAAHGALGAGVAPWRANAPVAQGVSAADVNRILNRNDLWLRATSDLARSLGTIAVIVLAIAMFQGVIVAGGASVPGVDRAVTAGSWAFVLAFICLPVGTILPGISFAGALPGYDWLTEASEAIRTGSPQAPGWGAFYGSALLAPVVSLVVAAVVMLRFSAGVEQGVIVTSVSELEEKLHREMSSIKLGAMNAPRSVGALNRAIGESTPMTTGASLSSPPAPETDPAPARRIGTPSIGESLKRPI